MTRCILVGQALWCNPSQTSADPPTSSGAMVGYDETSWNMLQVCCIHLPFSLLFFLCPPKRGWGVGIETELRPVFSLTSRLRGSQVKSGNEEDGGVTCKIDGSHWELRLCPDEQNKVSRRLEVDFKNSKNSFTLEEPFFCKLERVCMRMLLPRAYACKLSAHIRVIQYPYREPWLLPETHSSNEEMKNELKNNRRKADRQNKQWASGRAMPPNMWLVLVSGYRNVCAHIRDVFILWLHCALVWDVFSPLTVCVLSVDEYLGLCPDRGEKASRQQRDEKKKTGVDQLHK